MAKRANQQRLPGTVNSIAELDEAGLEYASIRDERMRLNKAESELKAKVHEMMKKHHLKTYKYEDVEILIIAGEEDVKVNISKEKRAADKAAREADGTQAEDGEALDGSIDGNTSDNVTMH